jgi:hypothetical protein
VASVATWLNFPLLEKGQLFPKEEVFRRQHASGSRGRENKLSEIEQD